MSQSAIRLDRSLILAARLLAAALICAFLYFGQAVLIPLGLALLVSFMLQPVVRLLRRWHFPHVVAVFTAAGAFAGVLTVIGWVIGGQITALTSQLPVYEKNIVGKVESLQNAMKGGALERARQTLDAVVKRVDQNEEKTAPTTTGEPLPVVIQSKSGWFDWHNLSTLGPILEPLSTAGLVALLVVLMLLKWSDLRSRLLGFVDGNVTGATRALDDAAQRIGRYLGMQLIVNGSMGVAVGLGLWVIGVDYAVLWGLCAALFRYVPYVGPVVAAALPLTMTVLTDANGWSQFMAVAALIVVLELVSNNVVEPWLYGSSLGLSEIGIIMAAVVWTLLWGAAGLVLATPLTVCLVVLGEHVQALAFFPRLLGDKPTLSPHYQLYQRLLARDEIESTDLMKAIAKDKDEPLQPSDVAVRALALARQERAQGRLRESGAQSLLGRLPRVLEAAEKDGEISPPDGPVPVTLWAQCPFTDGAVPIFARHLHGLPCHLEVIPSRELSGAALETLSKAEEPPIALCLAHVDRADFDRLRGVLKRVKTALPQLPVLVARWGGEPFDPSEREMLTSAGANGVADSLPQTRQWLAPRIVDRAAVA